MYKYNKIKIINKLTKPKTKVNRKKKIFKLVKLIQKIII